MHYDATSSVSQYLLDVCPHFTSDVAVLTPCRLLEINRVTDMKYTIMKECQQ